MNKKQAFLNGLRDGIPIGLGYYAVAFSLGIIARKAGLNAIEGFFNSVLARASAGEYAGLTMILTHATIVETFLVSFITNARYMLMTTALSQRFSQDTSVLKRIAVAFCMTDEIFGISAARKGRLSPYYGYGAIAISVFGWVLGTFLGAFSGQILPSRLISALGVALYGMFIAIVVPVTKEDKRVLLAVLAGIAISVLFYYAPMLKEISSGMRIIIVTMLVAGAAAFVFPDVPEGKEG